MKKKNILMIGLCIACISFISMGCTAKEQSISKMVSQMTLRQKIGQKIMPAFRTWTDTDGNITNVTQMNKDMEEAILNYGFGGIILFRENTAGTEQTSDLVYEMQSLMTREDALTHIPLLIALDQEGGNVVRLTTGTNLCGNMALGANGDLADTKQAAQIIGSELAALGINVDCAPDMDVNNNPANPVIGIRSFSSDADTVAKFGSAYMEGLHEAGVSCAIKHFPGHGNTATDSHTGLPCISKTYEELKQCELIPFQKGIEEGTDIVMTAHIQFPLIETQTYQSLQSDEKVYLPATLSKTMITEILRKDLDFQGVVVTDAMDMDAIHANFDSGDAARLAINAGVDILLMPVDMSTADGIKQMGTYIDTIEQMVQNGEIDEKQIDESVERILKLKKKRGILDLDLAPKTEKAKKAKEIVGSKEHHDTEWEITKKAITLVKNEKKVVPIAPKTGENLVLLCPYENEINSMEFAMQRLIAEDILSKDTKYRIYCYKDKEMADFETIITEADYIVASVETGKAIDMNPVEESGWQGHFIDELIKKVHENHKQIVLISAQLPYDAARYEQADAILLAYCAKGMNEIPTEYSGETQAYGPNLPAAVCITFGEEKPTGKLPVDILKLDKNYEYTEEVLYAVGFGLTE